jgi:hypothetical protein
VAKKNKPSAVDTVSMMKEGDQVIGFIINGKKFYSSDEFFVDGIKCKDLKGFNIGSIPPEFCIRPVDEFEGYIYSDGKNGGYACMNLFYPRKYWEHKFSLTKYVEAMEKAIRIRQVTNKDVEFDEITDDGDVALMVNFTITLPQDMRIEQAMIRFNDVLEEIEAHTERILDGQEITDDILENEQTFTVKVLLPLFRSMGFYNVKYNHSNREFGKDITFSAIDPFGVSRNYGVQVKAGDLSGEAGSQIDMIISQVDDAFKIPYIDTVNREKRNISDLIIAISGRFTNNAEEKILQKVKQPNIRFLSIDNIQSLLVEYMSTKHKS